MAAIRTSAGNRAVTNDMCSSAAVPYTNVARLHVEPAEGHGAPLPDGSVIIVGDIVGQCDDRPVLADYHAIGGVTPARRARSPWPPRQRGPSSPDLPPRRLPQLEPPPDAPRRHQRPCAGSTISSPTNPP